MKIISKRRAMTIYRQHPESRIFRYSTGKYQWHGSVCHYLGKDIPDIPGVLAVYTAADLHAAGIGPMRSAYTQKNRDGSAPAGTPRPVLAEGRVRFVGEAVAMVVAAPPTTSMGLSPSYIYMRQAVGLAGWVRFAGSASLTKYWVMVCGSPRES